MYIYIYNYTYILIELYQLYVYNLHIDSLMGKLYHCPKMGMKYNTILDPKSGVIQAKQHHLISGLRRQSNKISPISFVPRLKQIPQRENNLKILKIS